MRLLSTLVVMLVASRAAAAPDDAGIAFFEKKIRPVLVEHCYGCHSAKAKIPQAGLLLDSRDGLRKGGDRGPAIVPGDPDKSLLIKVVRYGGKRGCRRRASCPRPSSPTWSSGCAWAHPTRAPRQRPS